VGKSDLRSDQPRPFPLSSCHTPETSFPRFRSQICCFNKPYHHYEYLVMPLAPDRTHASSCFSINCTSTIHTIFMLQLDGSCSSKVVDTAPIPHTITSLRRAFRTSTHSSRSQTQPPPRSSRLTRLTKLFSSKKRLDSSFAHMSDSHEQHDTPEAPIICPLQTISPHTTISTLTPRPRPKSRIAFRRCKTYEATPRPCPHATIQISVESATAPVVSLNDMLGEGSHTVEISACKQAASRTASRKSSIHTSRKGSVAGLPVPLREEIVGMGSPWKGRR
jgi:hypothetical protein